MGLSPDRPVRVGLIGCGDVSVVHAEALAACAADGLAELVAVCDVDEDARSAAARRSRVALYADHRDLLAAGVVDAVHIATPHDAHVGPALDALEAGVHVLCEKPAAHTLDEAERFAAAAQAAQARGILTGICLQNRYNASSVALRELLDSGALGPVAGAYASCVWTRTRQYYRDRPWRGTWARAGGGLLINQALHTLDLVCWFLGEPTAVRGRASSRVYGDLVEVEDTTEAVLDHPGGARTTFYATLTAPRYRPVEVELTAEGGTAAIGDGLRVTYADGRTHHVPERPAPGVGRSYWGASHEALIRDFHTHVRQGRPFWLSPGAALPAQRVLTAVYDQSELPGRNHP